MRRAAAQRRPQVGDVRPKRFASASRRISGRFADANRFGRTRALRACAARSGDLRSSSSVSSASPCPRDGAYHRAPSPQFSSSVFFRLKAEATSRQESRRPSSAWAGVCRVQGERQKRERGNAEWKATVPGTDDYVRIGRARRRGRCAAETDLTIVRPVPVLGRRTSDCAMAARMSARTAGVFNVAALRSRT